MSFHHVALSVRDISKSQTFYEKLGFSQVHHWQAEDDSLTIIQLKLGDVILELAAYAQNGHIARLNLDNTNKIELGLKHLGLSVPDIQETYRQMLKEGYEMRDSAVKKGRTGIDYFFVIDPDGMWVEIVQDDRGY